MKMRSGASRYVSLRSSSTLATRDLGDLHLSNQPSLSVWIHLRWRVDLLHFALVVSSDGRVRHWMADTSSPFVSFRSVPTITELNKLFEILDVPYIYLPLYSRTLHTIEILCLAMFSLEFSVRILSAPAVALIQYDLSNFIDLVRSIFVSNPCLSRRLSRQISILSSALNLIGCHLHNVGQMKNFLSMYYWL